MHNGETLKLGLIGCGMMGAHYADAVSGLDGVELTACCDPLPAKLKEFTLKHKIAERVLKAGMPLMTEKPLANGLEECRRLRKLSDGSEVPVVVNFSKRHAPSVAAAKEIISASGAAAGVADKGKSTVGKHTIDSLDYVQAILTLEGGIPSTFVASRIDSGEKDTVSTNICCEKGCLSFNLAENRQSVKVKANRRIRFPEIIWSGETSIAGPEVGPGQELKITTRKPESNYIKFIRLLKGDSCDAPNLIDGLKVQGILEAIHESSENGGAPAIPEDFN